jgi:hypothetical protein
MAEEIKRFPDENAAGATVLLAGFVTSALSLVAATILWTGFLIAAALVVDRSLGPLALMGGLITVITAALFYISGIYGLVQSRKALEATPEYKRAADRT